MRHVDDEMLNEYILSGGGDDPEFAEVARHIKDCDECHTRFRGMSAFFEALTSQDVWQSEEAGFGSDAQERLVLEFAARCQQEYVQAREALGPLIADPVGFILERAERRQEYRTTGAVRVLAEAANTACERNPLHARHLADAALAIAEQLSADDYPRDTVRTLRALAWKERANALRFLAEYPAALDALDRAERELYHPGLHAYEIGNIAYIRAVVFNYMDRLDEACAEAAKSAAIFSAYGDTDRWMRARSVEAGVLSYRHEFAHAAAAFEQLRAYAESNDDAIGVARYSYNMATCFLELGDATRATPLLLDARRTFQERGLRTEVVRTDWMLGILARVNGRFEESIAQLRAARKASEALALPEEAAHVTLDLIESLLLAGSTREISSLCSEVMRYFRRSGRLRQALTAAAFLKEAAAHGSIRVETVRHVRSFVQRLERQPDLLFAPPAD
jgi:tetratricopeptide (TPR) repeat protein